MTKTQHCHQEALTTQLTLQQDALLSHDPRAISATTSKWPSAPKICCCGSARSSNPLGASSRWGAAFTTPMCPSRRCWAAPVPCLLCCSPPDSLHRHPRACGPSASPAARPCCCLCVMHSEINQPQHVHVLETGLCWHQRESSVFSSVYRELSWW